MPAGQAWKRFGTASREDRRNGQRHAGEREAEGDHAHRRDPLVKEQHGEDRDQRRMEVEEEGDEARRCERQRGEERRGLAAVAGAAERGRGGQIATSRQ